MTDLPLALLCAVFGLAIGSFLNVVVWRVPRGESVVRPPSSCPQCGNEIRPRDNVPVLGWLLLRGKCRDCGLPISARYPVVEALTGALFAVLAWRFGLDPALP
ncbi:MAG: Prepilin peptidase, partial [Frankiales bacterium]|nr:Prepilin peptidase [Frankiales bacterium]